MEVILILAGLGIILWAFSNIMNKSSITPSDQSKVESPIPIQFNLSVGPTSKMNKTIDFKPAQKTDDDYFLVNPSHSFKLRLKNLNQETADEIKRILETRLSRWESVNLILPLFAQYNIVCLEIEDYLAKYKPIFFKELDKLKDQHPDWALSNELDREDILEELYPEAFEAVEERISDYINIPLFTKEPKNITIDDELIKEYGFENLKIYFSYKPSSIIQAPADAFNRKVLESLHEKGLVKRGHDIPIVELLQTLRIKDIAELIPNGKKTYTRKAKAIEDFLSLDNHMEILKDKIPFREYFLTLPLPEKFSSIDTNEIFSNWEFQRAYVELFVKTFYSCARYHDSLKVADSNDKFEVVSYEFECPRSKKICNKKYRLNNLPILPVHVGCECDLESIF